MKVYLFAARGRGSHQIREILSEKRFFRIVLYSNSGFNSKSIITCMLVLIAPLEEPAASELAEIYNSLLNKTTISWCMNRLFYMKRK